MIKTIFRYYTVCDTCENVHSAYGKPVESMTQERAELLAVSDSWRRCGEVMLCPDCVEKEKQQ